MQWLSSTDASDQIGMFAQADAKDETNSLAETIARLTEANTALRSQLASSLDADAVEEKLMKLQNELEVSLRKAMNIESLPTKRLCKPVCQNMRKGDLNSVLLSKCVGAQR